MAIKREALERLVQEDLELIEKLTGVLNEVKAQYALAKKPITELTRLRIDENFISKLSKNLPLRLQEIKNLPEQQPILTKDRDWNDDQFQVHLQFKQMNLELNIIKRELERTVHILEEHLQTPELQVQAKKQEYESLLLNMTSVLHYPVAYREDPVFNENFQKFVDAFKTVKPMLEKELGTNAKAENYENAKQLLKIYLQENETATKARYAELKSIYEEYATRIEAKDTAVDELKKLIVELNMLPLKNESRESLRSFETWLLDIAKNTYLIDTKPNFFEKQLLGVKETEFVDKYKAGEQQCLQDISKLAEKKFNFRHFIEKQKQAYPEYFAQNEKNANLLAKTDLILQQARESVFDAEKLKSHPQIKELYATVVKKIDELQQKNYFPARQYNDSYVVSMERRRKRCLKDFKELRSLVVQLKDKVIFAENQLQEKEIETRRNIADVNRKIFAQIEIFSSKAEDIKSKLNEYQLSTSDITKLDLAFNEEITETISSEPGVLDKVKQIVIDEVPKSESELMLGSLQEKLDNLIKINKELENTTITKEKDIAQVVSKEIDIIVERIELERNHCKKIFESGNEHIVDEELKKFKFTIKEAVLYNQLNDFKVTTIDYKVTTIDYKAIASSTQMKEMLEQVKQQEQEFNQQVGQFNSIIDAHKKVQLMASLIRENDSVEPLFGLVNESTKEDSIALLEKISLYKTDLLSHLYKVKNLLLLNQEGRGHIIEFIDDLVKNEEPRAILIKERLELLSLLEMNNISPEDRKNYITKSHVIDAVKRLHAKEMDEFITKENLDNKQFCDAVRITTVDKNQIQTLSQDLNKCELIISFEQLDKENFQTIVPKIIALDPEIAHSINIIRGKAPKLTKPWLILAAQEGDSLHSSAELRTILGKPNRIELAIPFLNGIINEGSIRFLDILGNSDEITVACKFASRSSEQARESSINAQLLLLDQANQHKDFAKYSKVITSINKFIEDGNFTDTQLATLYQFRREAIPMLLAPNVSMRDKQEQLCELAREKFPLSGFDLFVDMVIAAINSAFTFFGGSKYGFFERVKTNETDMLNKTFKKADNIAETQQKEAEVNNEQELQGDIPSATI